MSALSLRAAILLSFALLGVTGPCAPATSPSAGPAPIDPEVSAGAEGPEGLVGHRGAGLIFTAALTHPDFPTPAASASPIVISHTSDWSHLVHFEVTALDGTIQPWPVVMVAAGSPRIALDHTRAGLLSAYVAPADTGQLANGSYRVRAVLDASLATQPGSYQGRAQSAAAVFELRDAPAPPTADEDEQIALFDAQLRLLMGDRSGARAALEALVARQPASIEGLAALSDLDSQDGLVDSSLARIETALDAWKTLPAPGSNPSLAEPPLLLLTRQHDLLNTRLRLASGDARPALSARISAKAPSATPNVIEVDVTFTNNGAATALDARVAAVKARTLQGVGNVALDGTLGPALPIALGTLDPGASTTVRLNLLVDPGVVRFALTEDGAVDADFGTFGFTLTQATYK